MSIKILGQEFEYPATWTGVVGLIGVCLTITVPACMWAMSNPNQARDVIQRVIGQIETNRLTTADMANALDAHAKSIYLLKADLDFLSDQIRKFDAMGDQGRPQSKTNVVFPARATYFTTNWPLSIEAWHLQTNQIRNLGDSIRKRLDWQKDSLDRLQKSMPLQ